MKSILIIGLGKTGRHLAERFVELKNEVMVIDKKEDLVNDVAPLVTASQIGDCSRDMYISSLGIQNFDICICAIAEDFQASLEITALLKDHNAKFLVAVAHSQVHEKFLYRIGADQVLYPEREIAFRIATQYSMDNILDYIKVDGDYSILEIKAPASWIGKTIVQAQVRNKYMINIVAIKVNGKTTLMLDGDYVFNTEDTLFIMGDMKNIQKLAK